MKKPLLVFCCYARNDQEYLYELRNHLMVLQREGLIEIKADINISPGTEWERAINRHLEEANIILLLISSDFIASDYCYEKEMRQAIARHKQGTACVVPVIIRPTAWENMSFGKMQALPKDTKPVISWQNRDDAWKDVVGGIREVINELLMRGPVLPFKPQPSISRRAVLIQAGLGTIATVGLIYGGIALLTHSQATSRPSATSSATPIPLGTLLFTYRGHSSGVLAVVWSPDKRRVASASGDHTVQVWNATDGSKAFTYRGHSDIVTAVAWSPDGLRIASGSIDRTVQVWNATDGSNVFTYRGHSDHVISVAWSPHEKLIASGSDDYTVQVWDASNGSNIFTYHGHASHVHSVAWSLDGKRIASGSLDQTVQVWDAFNGSNVFTYYGHSDWVWVVVWSPNSQRIASGSRDGTVQVWNATDGSNVFIYHGHSGGIHGLAWSPDGKLIASGSYDRTVQVWNATDGSNGFIYRGHSDDAWTVAWSPDSQRIASGSFDHTVQVWEGR